MIGPANESWFPNTSTLVASETAPAPVWLKFPATLIGAKLERIRAPELLIVKEPLFVVVTGASKVKAVPVKFMPPV